MKRVCVYCGEKISGYPHVTVWDEQTKKSEGVRFHTISEAVLFFSEDKLSNLIDKWNSEVIPLRQEKEIGAASAVKACAVELEEVLHSFRIIKERHAGDYPTTNTKNGEMKNE